MNITSGRTEAPNNNIGGVKNVYLFDYVEYQNYLIQTNGANLISYPNTIVYKYELRADANTLNEDFETDETGNYYSQSFSFILKGDFNYTYNPSNLLGKRIGAIVETRLGNFKILGLKNGCKVTSVKKTTGGSRTDFVGYNIDVECKELNMSYFITDLNSVGFEVYQELLNFIFQDNNNFTFQDYTNFIFQ